jgi:excisionase family DNA binding protein
LAEAVAALAATITEIIDERLREEFRAQKTEQIVQPGADPFITKLEVADRMRVSLGTVSAWMRKGYVPYIRLGRSVRFDWKLVNERLSARFGRGPGLSL